MKIHQLWALMMKNKKRSTPKWILNGGATLNKNLLSHIAEDEEPSQMHAQSAKSAAKHPHKHKSGHKKHKHSKHHSKHHKSHKHKEQT